MYLLVFVLSLAAGTLGQQPAWGQCGGSSWNGRTDCVKGYVCQVQNPWYSQCVPGTASPSTTISTSFTTSNKPVTSSISKSTTTSPNSTPSSTNVQYLISFGDSYSQTGFDPTLSLASSSNPLGNPSFPGWTTSGGPNWIGYYVSQFNCSPVYSYNFASGGATTDASLVVPFASTVLSFVDQVNLYLKSAKTPGFVKWNAANSLFAVWIGVNDVGNSWYSSTYTTLVEKIMNQYINQTQTLYDAGARNFLFLSVPPIQLTPAVLAQGTSSVNAEAAAIKQYNAALKSRVGAFAVANPQAKIYLVDTTEPFMTALSNPTAYGARDATCFDASGTTCLWFNDYHPGMAIHKLVAQAIRGTMKGC